MDISNGTFPRLLIGSYVALSDFSNGLGWAVAAVPTTDAYEFTCATSTPSPEVELYSPINDGTTTYGTAIASYMDGLYDNRYLSGFKMLFAH
jgi:hypothetical protein